MLALYLFCFALGGGFLLLSVLGGEGGEGGLDTELELDGLEGGIEADAGHDAAASRVFSLRTITYGLFGFGATGAALSALGVGGATTLLFALAGGGLAGALVGTVFRFLGATESGALQRDANLVGLTGTVSLPMQRDRPGQVILERGGRRTTLRALPHPGTADDPVSGDPASWRDVVVLDVVGGVLQVAPLGAEDRDLLEPPPSGLPSGPPSG